jgi:hypothetical protein
MRRSTQVLKEVDMSGYRLAEGGIGYIGDIEISAGCLDDGADCGVMDVADFGEQMVFDLVVQASTIPGGQLAVWRKIRCRFDLMDCPLIFDLCRVIARKATGFDDMSNLKDRCNSDPNDCVNKEEETEYVQDGVEKHRENEYVAKVKQPDAKEEYRFGDRMSGHRVITDFTAEIFLKVAFCRPDDSHEAIDREGIPVLKLMPGM